MSTERGTKDRDAPERMLLTSRKPAANVSLALLSLVFWLCLCLQTGASSEVLQGERPLAVRKQEGERPPSQARKRKKMKTKKAKKKKKRRRSCHSRFHLARALASSRAKPLFPRRLLTSPAMILSFYLPAMVVIVLTALATCVSGQESWGEEGEKGKRMCHAFRFRCIRSSRRSLSTSTPGAKKKNSKKKQPPLLRRAARPAPRAGHRARGLDHVGVNRRFGPFGRLDDTHGQ